MTKIEIKWNFDITSIGECNPKTGEIKVKDIASQDMVVHHWESTTWRQEAWYTVNQYPKPLPPSSLRVNCKCHMPESPYVKFYKEFMRQLKEEGYHEDVIERIDFVLKEIEGIAFIHNLTSNQMKDQEFVVQGLLELYKRLTG